MKINNEKVYSQKSECYIAQQPKLYFTWSSKNTAKTTWGQIKGATSYSIYLATSQNGPYVKQGTTTNNQFILKNLKQNQKYYVYVTANKKVGNKTYRSTKTYVYTFRIRV